MSWKCHKESQQNWTAIRISWNVILNRLGIQILKIKGAIGSKRTVSSKNGHEIQKIQNDRPKNMLQIVQRVRKSKKPNGPLCMKNSLKGSKWPKGSKITKIPKVRCLSKKVWKSKNIQHRSKSSKKLVFGPPCSSLGPSYVYLRLEIYKI